VFSFDELSRGLPTAAVPAGRRIHRDIAQQWVGDAGRRCVTGVDRQGDDLDLLARGVLMTLAGVEAAVAGQGRVEDQAHETGLSGSEQVAEVSRECADGAIGPTHRQARHPLVEDQGPVWRLRDVPRIDFVTDPG